MSFLIARIMRSIPLLVFMAVLAVVLYLVISYRRSPAHAKETLIKVFTVINGVVIGFFGLVSLYALFEANSAVLDIAVCFALVGVLGLAITLWCRHVFLKNNPSYRKKPMKTKTKRRFPWEK